MPWCPCRSKTKHTGLQVTQQENKIYFSFFLCCNTVAYNALWKCNTHSSRKENLSILKMHHPHFSPKPFLKCLELPLFKNKLRYGPISSVSTINDTTTVPQETNLYKPQFLDILFIDTKISVDACLIESKHAYFSLPIKVFLLSHHQHLTTHDIFSISINIQFHMDGASADLNDPTHMDSQTQ